MVIFFLKHILTIFYSYSDATDMAIPINCILFQFWYVHAWIRAHARSSNTNQWRLASIVALCISQILGGDAVQNFL